LSVLALITTKHQKRINCPDKRSANKAKQMKALKVKGNDAFKYL